MDMINIGYSGASTAQVELNVTAQNTANTMTTGYTRQVAEISTIGASGGSPNSAGNGVQVDSIRRVSNQYQVNQVWYALFNTSDAADEKRGVGVGGRRDH